jgi:hypothetical protein
MTDWATTMERRGLLTAEESKARAAGWTPADHDPRHYPFPIRPDTGKRDLRRPEQ